MFGIGKAARARTAAADRLYGSLVAAARQPAFYARWGVPDTAEGRFEMIAIHAFAVMRRLKRAGAAGASLSQTLYDTLFEDMDRNLREMGIGDMGVGKRIKKLAKALYGRISVYEAGLGNADDVALLTALRRNVYSGAEGADASALARYVRALGPALDALTDGELLGGSAAFPAIPD